MADPATEWGKTWLVVTGASRGLGACICEEFSKHMAPGSSILGCARSLKGLLDVGKRIEELEPKIKFCAAELDLSNCITSSYETALADSLGKKDTDVQTAILVHNAGSLGALHYLREIEDMELVREHFQLNISSVVPLTSVFLRLARSLPSKPNIYVINISSLCAIAPSKSWGLYCSSKAARDMMFKVLALEEGEKVRVLNYSPGPLDNDMQEKARTLTQDPELRALYNDMKLNNKLVQVKDTVHKLIGVLKEGKFASGDHFDYYD